MFFHESSTSIQTLVHQQCIAAKQQPKVNQMNLSNEHDTTANNHATVYLPHWGVKWLALYLQEPGEQ